MIRSTILDAILSFEHHDGLDVVGSAISKLVRLVIESREHPDSLECFL
jgi:hypothetical protein